MPEKLWFCVEAHTKSDVNHTLERQLEMIQSIFPIAARNKLSHFGSVMESQPTLRQGLEYCERWLIYGFKTSFTSYSDRDEIVRAIEAIVLDQGFVYYGVGKSFEEARAELEAKKNTVQ